MNLLGAKAHAPDPLALVQLTSKMSEISTNVMAVMTMVKQPLASKHPAPPKRQKVADPEVELDIPYLIGKCSTLEQFGCLPNELIAVKVLISIIIDCVFKFYYTFRTVFTV